MLSDKERQDIKYYLIDMDSNKRLEKLAETILMLSGMLNLETDDVFNETIILTKGLLMEKEKNGAKEHYTKLYNQFSDFMETLFEDLKWIIY